MTSPYVIFMTGASGAGKTTLVAALNEQCKARDDVTLLHFDSIGVPSRDEMNLRYGSGKEWQKAKTFAWVKRIAQHYNDRKLVIIEGQTEPLFIQQALEENGLLKSKIMLVDAADHVRHQRLIEERKQPDLVNPTMDNWARYLRDQANSMGIEVIDSTSQDPHTLARNILNIMAKEI